MRIIYLISCVKSRLSFPAKARDLYTSTLFTLSLKYALQQEPDAINILSANYGLVDLEQVISPYELTSNTMKEAEKRTWAKKIVNALHKKANLQQDHFVLIAGNNYRKYLLPKFRYYEVPFEGLPFGKLFSELKRRTS